MNWNAVPLIVVALSAAEGAILRLPIGSVDTLCPRVIVVPTFTVTFTVGAAVAAIGAVLALGNFTQPMIIAIAAPAPAVIAREPHVRSDALVSWRSNALWAPASSSFTRVRYAR